MTHVSSPRKRRHALSGLVLAMIFALIAPAAYGAGGTAGTSPSAPGSGGGGSNNNFTFVCGANNQGFQSGGGRTELFFESVFARCGPGNEGKKWESDSAHLYCNTGSLVYRFYSRANQQQVITSTFAWSRSRANYTPCTNQSTVLFAPHPADVPGQAVPSTWWNSTTGGGFKDRPITRTKDGTVTSGPVERRVGDCTTMQSGINGRPANPVAGFYARDAAGNLNPDLRAGRELLFQAYRDWASVLGANGGLTAVDGVGGQVPTNSENLSFGDGLSCSSDYDFMTDSKTEDPVYYGYCWVPLENRARVFRNRDNSNDVRYAYYVPAVHGGERVSTATQGIANASAQGAYSSWKNIIADDVRTMGDVGASYNPSAGVANNSRTVDPFRTGNAAADSARNAAVCAGGKAASSNRAQSAAFAAAPSHIELNATMDSAFQVGGEYRPASMSVRRGQLYCKPQNADGTVISNVNADGSPNPAGDPILCSRIAQFTPPTLQKLYFGVDVVGSGSYQRCETPTTPEGCRYLASVPTNYVAHRKGIYNARGIDATVSMNKGMKFYSATMPNQNVTVRLTGGADRAGSPYATVLLQRYQMEAITACPPTAQWNSGLSTGGQCIDLPEIKVDLPPIEVRVGVKVKPAPGTPAPNAENGMAWTNKVIGATDDVKR